MTRACANRPARGDQRLLHVQRDREGALDAREIDLTFGSIDRVAAAGRCRHAIFRAQISGSMAIGSIVLFIGRVLSFLLRPLHGAIDFLRCAATVSQEKAVSAA